MIIIQILNNYYSNHRLLIIISQTNKKGRWQWWVTLMMNDNVTGLLIICPHTPCWKFIRNFSGPGLFKQSKKSFSYHCFCQLTMVGNTYPENTCTFQSGCGIQKNSSCNTVEFKPPIGAHDVSRHKLFHKLIISAQLFKEMPPGTLRMRLG